MGKQGAVVDLDRLEHACSRLGEVVLDPATWRDVMADLCLAVGAEGSALLQSDVRTPDIPRTAGVDELLTNYFKNGWHTQDIRARRGVPLLLKGARVIVDEDVVTPDEIRRSPFYCEAVLPLGFQWFAAVGFNAGPALWGLTIQRKPQQGAFTRRDKAVLAGLSQKLTEVASLSHAAGRVALSGAINALNNIQLSAVAVDRFGFVLDANDRAQPIFDRHVFVSNRRLVLSDPQAHGALEKLLDRLCLNSDASSLQPDPVVARRPDLSDVLIRALPVHPAARTPFLGARAILTFTSVEPRPRPQPLLLANIFGLTPAEARLASIIAKGSSLEEAAEQLEISRDTVRNQLRAIFSKTATHRQSELVALLSGL